MTAASEDIAELIEQVWFTTREAADYCRRHPVTVRKAAAEGTLRSSQAGSARGRRYRIEWLDDWINAR